MDLSGGNQGTPIHCLLLLLSKDHILKVLEFCDKVRSYYKHY